MQSELIGLAAALKATDLIIENQGDTLFRLSITPEVVYFDDKLFSFAVKDNNLSTTQSKIPVIIHREALDTALGKVKGKTEEFIITVSLAKNLQAVFVRQYASDNDEAVKIEDTYKKRLHNDPRFLSLGLKSLIKREVGIMKFVLPFIST